MKRVYLDYAATCPVFPEMLSVLGAMGSEWHNSSSQYGSAAFNRSCVEKCREKIAAYINAEPEEIIFTSGGSEANALAIDGFLKAHPDYKAICSTIEHSSILDNPNIVPSLTVDSTGLVNTEQMNMEDWNNTLLSLMMCNNEIGTYQPIKEVTEIVHSKGGIIHCDAVQTLGKTPIDVKYLDVDMMSFSGHKIGALKGIGFLYVKKDIKLSPIVYGTQESGLRGGTYNDLGCKSLSYALDHYTHNEKACKAKLNYLEEELLKDKRIHINGSIRNRCGSILNIWIQKISITGQQIVALLDEAGFEVSAGSACHSGDDKPSHVLKAIGLSDDQATHAIRISIGDDTAVYELDAFIRELKGIIGMYAEA